MKKKVKVLFILNNTPNYKDIYLRELGKKVDLTVISQSGKNIGLNEPEHRKGYNYIAVNSKSFFGVNLIPKQYLLASQNDFDTIIFGPSIREPFALLNLLRKKTKIVLFGHILSHSYRSKGNFINNLLYKWSFNKADNFLVHSDYIKNMLIKMTNKPIYSFNNTYFFRDEIYELPFDDKYENRLNVIWIGRYRPQKLRNFEKLIELAKRNEKVSMRIIGTGIINGLQSSNIPSNVKLFDEVFEEEKLREHFQWSHCVMSPGHIGLLVINAARYGRPVIIDNQTFHAPEIQLAIEAKQAFINFENVKEVDSLVNQLINNKSLIKEMGHEIASVMYDRYHLDYMVSQTLKAIKD